MTAAASTPNVWWLAINSQTTSFEELKHRKVVAQGWPKLGDLSALCRFVPAHEDAFKAAVQLFGEVDCTNYDWWAEDRKLSRTPSVMWNLLNLQRGDVIVGPLCLWPTLADPERPAGQHPFRGVSGMGEVLGCFPEERLGGTS